MPLGSLSAESRHSNRVTKKSRCVEGNTLLNVVTIEVT
jgi:hypothetical protein